jgi:hypothetical protein
MADGDREGIARVIWFHGSVEPEEIPNHKFNLLFFGAAIADHTVFYRHRRVFAQLKSSLRDHQQRHAANMSQLQSGFRVLGVEHLFDGYGDGPGFADDVPQTGRYLDKALLQRVLGTGSDDAIPNEAVGSAIAFHGSVAGAFGAAVDAEDSHPILAGA